MLTPATGARLFDMVMLGNNGTTQIATPPSADSDRDGFTVADGSAVPPPPGS